MALTQSDGGRLPITILPPIGLIGPRLGGTVARSLTAFFHLCGSDGAIRGLAPSAQVITLGPVARQLFDPKLELVPGLERRAGQDSSRLRKIVRMHPPTGTHFEMVVHGATIHPS